MAVSGGALRARGFGSVKAFQAAFNGPGAPLTLDGVAGPKTTAAFAWTQRTGLLSAHFAVSELDCPHCHLAHVDRSLLVALERLRAHVGHPLRILSGYRCPVHNRAVGGADGSQHLYGRAVDFAQGTGLSIATVRAAKAFTGIGSRSPGSAGSSVGHADVRPGSVSRPSVFFDASVG